MMQTEVRSREVRSLGKNHQNRSGVRSAGWNEIFESETWLDSREFKLYAFKVAKVLMKADRPLCTREIHEALADQANVRWTQDALEAIRNVEKIGILPTRYRIIAGDLAQPKKLDQDEEHNRIFEN